MMDKQMSSRLRKRLSSFEFICSVSRETKLDQDKNAGVVFLMRAAPFPKIYVTAAKILGLVEITLRILDSIGAGDERGTVGSGGRVWAGLSD